MKRQDIEKFVSKLKRKPNGHKYDYGHILVIAGSKIMPGAGVLCCLGALRSGAGLVTYAVEEDFFNQVCTISKPEIMFFVYKTAYDVTDFIKSRKISSIVIGPGLKMDKDVLRKFIKQIFNLIDIPIILDASGLSCFNGVVDELKNTRAKCIITPHLGEFSKLLNVSPNTIKNNREEIMTNFTKDGSFICVLKGNNTLVSSGNKMYKNSTGTPAMATAGSGDVLSGVIASFSSITDDLFEAAKFAVFVHGLAGEIAEKDRGQIGVVASDIAENTCYAIKQMMNTSISSSYLNSD
ncbi:MAG: NAD(P)H-hydrate dehydratase [Endomicrobium sp.]|jgi:NAD(P)H-hydrate epimerase|nr:NAD(P)H-hydrate dehydratase [Endomicrobium sp.]